MSRQRLNARTCEGVVAGSWLVVRGSWWGEASRRAVAANWDNGRPAEPSPPTGTTGVPPVAWAARGPSMERAGRPFSQLARRPRLRRNVNAGKSR